MDPQSPGPKSTKRQTRRRLIVGTLAGVLVLGAMLFLQISPASAPQVSFPDVPASHPYHDAITDLAGRGIINGYTNGNFGPGDPVLRQQFAKMIVLTGGYPVSSADVCPFSDVEQSTPPDLYPDHYVAVAAAHAVTMGKTAWLFAPSDHISRYQVISMVVRAADDLSPGLLATPPATWSGTSGWGDNPTHGANARRAEYNGLLAGLPLTSLDPWGDMPRGEVAQVLHNLLSLLPPAVPAHFEHLGGGLTSSPAAITWGPDHLDAYARGPDGALWHTYRHYSTVWSAWESLGGSIMGRPVPVTGNEGDVEVFAVGANSDMLHWLYGGPWLVPESLGYFNGSEPAVYHPQPGYASLFALGGDGQLWNCVESGGSVSAWQAIPSALKGPPALAMGPGPDVFVFVAGYDRALWMETSGQWTLLGGSVQGKPAAVAQVVGSDIIVDVFARSMQNQLLHWNYDSIAGWASPENLGGSFLDDPTVVTWGNGHLDVFVRGPGNSLWHRYRQVGSAWSDWIDLGGEFQGPPFAVSWGEGRIDVFGWGFPNNDLVHWWYDGSW